MTEHPRDLIYLHLEEERIRQDHVWGEQNHPDGTGSPYLQHLAAEAREACEARFKARIGTWHDILAEEFFEAMSEHDPAKLRAELIQTAAVAIAWVEAIDRRNA